MSNQLTKEKHAHIYITRVQGKRITKEDDVMIERYHIEERNDITQHRKEKRKSNRGVDPNRKNVQNNAIYLFFFLILFAYD